MTTGPFARGLWPLRLLRPDQYVTDVRAIDLEQLRATGIRALLLDLDNTVSPHHSPAVIPEIRDWLGGLSDAGFEACFVSNNWHSNIHERAAALGYPVVHKAMKPLPFGFWRAARRLGVPIAACAVVGDQLFTDILGGHWAGATCILVMPLTTNDLPHTRVLRNLERSIMGARTPQA